MINKFKETQYTERYGLYNRGKDVWLWTGSFEELRETILSQNPHIKSVNELRFSGLDTSNFYLSENDAKTYYFPKQETCPRWYGFYKWDSYGYMEVINIKDIVNEIYGYNIAHLNNVHNPEPTVEVPSSRELFKKMEFSALFMLYETKNSNYAYKHDYFRKEPISGTGGGKWFRSGYYRRPNHSARRRLQSIYSERYGEIKEYSAYFNKPRLKSKDIYIGWYDDYPRGDVNRSWKKKKIRHQWQKNKR